MSSTLLSNPVRSQARHASSWLVIPFLLWAHSSPSSAPATDPKPGTATNARVDFCGIVVKCGLPKPKDLCPDSLSKGVPKLTYDTKRCLEAKKLYSRGVGPDYPIIGYRLYRYLGMEYRVIYNVDAQIPISEARLAYLLKDLPLAAKLVSHFQKSPYSAEYLDGALQRHFKGTKGKNLKGEARLISGTTEEKKLFYFGYGVVEVAWWRLKGPALMEFDYAQDPKKGKGIHYRMKILVFPGNGIINSIMNLGLFRKIVFGKIREVLDDITQSAHKLASGGDAEIRKSKAWTSEEKKKIETFLKLP